MPAARVGPKALLSLCHEVDELSEKIREFGSLGLQNLDARRRRTIKRIRTALHGPQNDGFRARLRALKSMHGLGETEVLILLLLFNRRVRKADHVTSGRDLLEALTRNGSEIIEAARFLHPDAPLVRSVLVTSDAVLAEDALDGGFRIADRAFAALYRAFHGLAGDIQEPDPTAPYASAADHLLDLRLLCDVAKRRAGRLFPLSVWAESAANEDRDVEELSSRYEKLRLAIAARERATPESVRLPLVLLRAEFALTDGEEVIILTLLQQELFAAHTLFELSELVRLVSTSDEEVLTLRAIVAPEGKLRQAGLLCIEEEPAGKDAFATACLPGWLTERLLGNLDQKGAIRSDERISFREYLEHLRGSDDFFRRL